MYNENNNLGNQIPNNNQSPNPVNPTISQFQTGINNNVVQSQGYGQTSNVEPQVNPNMYQQPAMQQQIN